MEELFVKEDKECSIYSVGRKGMKHYSFAKQSCYKAIPNPIDSFSFEEAGNFCEELKNLFLKGEFHEIYVSYSKVLSYSNQKPEIIKLLPISSIADDYEEDMEMPPASFDYSFEPSAEGVFACLLPLFLKVKIYTCFLETAYSEFSARRMAMKNATDASNDMISNLTTTYNRARQAKITNEILEVIGGTAGLK
jgi:F-type H+-transporting ATPase subunit gamma